MSEPSQMGTHPHQATAPAGDTREVATGQRGMVRLACMTTAC